MLTLTILRHAKSSWGDASLGDIERPLNKRGKDQTRLIGNALDAQDIDPDLIICSSATRACETLQRVREYWPSEAETLFEQDLYLASPQTILALLHEHGEDFEHIMLVGHNPGLHEIADTLAERGNKDDLALLFQKYPTGTLCTIKFDTHKWKNIGKAAGELIYLATPKKLANQ